jgi:hypothetical protein
MVRPIITPKVPVSGKGQEILTEIAAKKAVQDKRRLDRVPLYDTYYPVVHGAARSYTLFQAAKKTADTLWKTNVTGNTGTFTEPVRIEGARITLSPLVVSTGSHDALEWVQKITDGGFTLYVGSTERLVAPIKDYLDAYYQVYTSTIGSASKCVVAIGQTGNWFALTPFILDPTETLSVELRFRDEVPDTADVQLTFSLVGIRMVPVS